MDADSENDLDKAKRLHIIRQTVAKNKVRGPHGEFVKAGIQENSEQGIENGEQVMGTSVQDIRNSEQEIGKDTISNQNTPSSSAQFVSFAQDKSKASAAGDDPPLVDVKVTNPISYLKKWWNKIIGNEGIEMKWSLKVKPLTAFFLVAFIFSGGVTISLLNRIKDKTPVAQYIPTFGSEPSVQRAFSGQLEKNSSGEYYLVTANEVITLMGEQKVYFGTFVGKKVLVNGMYNDGTKILDVEEIKELTLPQSD